MRTEKIREPLARFLKAIPKSIAIKDVLVFGSYLEGGATAESDIDVVVISDDFKRYTEDARLELLYRASRDIEPGIEPWGFTGEEIESAPHLSTLDYIKRHGLRVKI